MLRNDVVNGYQGNYIVQEDRELNGWRTTVIK
jgi:hypothetical protein